MHSLYFLALFPAAALAALNGRCTGAAAAGIYDIYGICVSTTTCNNYGGVYISGGCPNDPTNVKCCVVGLLGSTNESPCGGSESHCMWTSTGCTNGRRWVSGACPGGDNYRCCRRD